MGITNPILDTGTLCLHCGACARGCPGGAIPSPKEKDARITVDFGEKQVYFGDTQMGRCTLSHHGMNNECSPFLKKEFPNMAFDVRNSEMTEEEKETSRNLVKANATNLNAKLAGVSFVETVEEVREVLS